MQTSPSQPYELLAQYYDQFFTFHLEWYRQARRRLLAEILPQVRVACDLACGTGTTALEFAQRGISVYGVDLSPTMCRLARTKVTRTAKVTIRKSDLAPVANAVARALSPA